MKRRYLAVLIALAATAVQAQETEPPKAICPLQETAFDAMAGTFQFTVNANAVYYITLQGSGYTLTSENGEAECVQPPFEATGQPANNSCLLDFTADTTLNAVDFRFEIREDTSGAPFGGGDPIITTCGPYTVANMNLPVSLESFAVD